MNLTPAAAPPRIAEREDAARAARQVALRERVDGGSRQARVVDPLDGRMRGKVRATASADSQWRGMRRCSVSIPCSSRNADIGDSVGPSVRIVSMRAFIVKPKSPNVSKKRTP